MCVYNHHLLPVLKAVLVTGKKYAAMGNFGVKEVKRLAQSLGERTKCTPALPAGTGPALCVSVIYVTAIAHYLSFHFIGVKK